MSTITYKNLASIPIKTIHKAWMNAFSDYAVPVSTTRQELTYLLERRGYEPQLSFGAFDEEVLIGFILNGIRMWNDKKTVYDTGTGLIKAYRRQGIATNIFDYSLPILKKHDIEQYLLEVLKPNKSAFDLYLKKGFQIVREFDCYISPASPVKFRKQIVVNDVQLIEINIPDWNLFRSFWDFTPSWQNSIEALERKQNRLTIIGLENKDGIIGYGIIEKHTGDIPQIAVHKAFRRKNFGTILLHKLLELSRSNQLRVINADASNASFKSFMKSINLQPTIGQYEMLLNL
ncbi:MAG: GNAT family N-acetyltransferase [Deferribacteres bacterium]|nr:GNAT family N-acetyltransferase [candidate division KSB1 bacterium]MCB9502091.1 GNAT family N-acetyltransferase [Deferribacteres bacterium]